MKIFFVNSVVDYGSTGKIVRDLANELKLQGHEVCLVYGRHAPKTTVDTFSIVDKTNTLFHVFMSRILGRHGMHSTKATKILIRKIKEEQPDIIHLHNLHGYYLNVPLFLSFLKTFNGKILWTLHDAWLISGSSAYFDYNGCKVWDEGCVECNSTKDYPRSDFIKRQRKNFNWKKEGLTGFDNLTFITPSHWLKELIGQSYLKEYPCAVVNNGIDTTIFKPTTNPIVQEKYQNINVLLGVASVWEPRKGLDDFIALSKILDENCRIVLIGLSKEQLKVLPSTIDGIERTNDAKELASYYSQALCYLNPTYEDNYPTTNLEALACDTPVIAYDTGGNKEVKGITIVDQGNVLGLYEAIKDLIGNKPTLILDDLSKEHFAHSMMKFYK